MNKNKKISLKIEQSTEQKIKQSQKGGGSGAPPSRHLWFKEHGPKCTCPDCRRYYILEDGELKEKMKSILTLDRDHTLDTYEYVKTKKRNKFRDAFILNGNGKFD